MRLYSCLDKIHFGQYNVKEIRAEIQKHDCVKQ